MGKIAFVFSGQGDQFPGMGKDMYETYPAAKRSSINVTKSVLVRPLSAFMARKKN